MNSEQQDRDMRDVPAGLEAWLPENAPDNANARCRHGCCLGPYCMHTYLEQGPTAAIMEAYRPRKQTAFERLRRLFTRKTQSKGKP
jgi:hypothetical protein